MELEITKQRETPLLERTRISAMVDFENKTPSRVQLRKDIAKKLKTDESLIIIRHVYRGCHGNFLITLIISCYISK